MSENESGLSAENDAHVETVYPRPEHEPNRRLHRRWRVDYDGLVCEMGGIASWSKGYRTYLGARIAAWFWYQVGTYGGGSVTITNTRVTPPGSGRDQ